MNKVYEYLFSAGSFVTFDQRPEREFHAVNQVHGNKVIINLDENSESIEADGMLSEFDKVQGIRTADCLPILLLGENSYSMVHAGWRGLAQAIYADAEIQKIRPHTILIGPSIQKCCFKVTKDFQDNFPHTQLIERNEQFFFDLQGFARGEMDKLYPDAKIIDEGVCTHCQKKFHSYRRDKTVERNWNLFLPNS